MKNVKFIFMLWLFFAMVQSVCATDYYFSSSDGNDGNAGTSPGAAKQSVSAMQTVINSISAGDAIYLKRGSVWRDVHLVISNKDGSSGSPIIFGTYGSGNNPVLYSTTRVTSGISNSGNVYSVTSGSLPTSINHVNYTIGVIINDSIEGHLARYPDSGALSADDDSGNTTTLNDASESWTTNEWAGGYTYLETIGNEWGYFISKITSNTSTSLSLTDPVNINRSWDDSDSSKYIIQNVNPDSDYEYAQDGTTLSVYSPVPVTSLEFATDSLALSMNGSDYWHISGLDFRYGNRYNIHAYDCDNLTIDSCRFDRCGYTNVYAAYCDDMVFHYNEIEQATYAALFTEYGDVTANNNYVHNCGVEPIGYNIRMQSTTFKFIYGSLFKIMRTPSGEESYSQYNRFDSIRGAYETHWTLGDVYIRYNLITNYGMSGGDYGAYYHYGDFTSSITLSFAYNMILNAHRNLWIDEAVWPGAIYPDGNDEVGTYDHNSIYNANGFIYTNRDIGLTFTNNNVANAREGYYENSPRWSLVSLDNMIDGTSRIYNYTFKHNTICFQNHTNEAVYALRNCNGYNSEYHMTVPSTDLAVDSNKYYNVTVSSPDIYKYYENYTGSEINSYSLSEVQSNFGWDSHSTMNNTSWYMANTSLSDQDDFTQVLCNWSGSSKSMSLGNCTMKKTDGTNVSGSISVPSFYSEMLFYVSGDLSTLETLYEDTTLVPNFINTSSAWDSTYALTISYSGTGSGSVSPGSGSYPADTTLSLSATANTGSVFSGWSGDTTTTTNPLSVIMWKNKSITATFTDTTSSSSDTIAYYRFEYDVTDETGVHDGTLYGGSYYYTPPAEGSYALNLDGTGRYVDCDTITLGDSFSISGYALIWAGSGTRVLFGTTTSSSPDGIVGKVDTGTGVFSLVTGDGSSSATATSTSGQFTSGSWFKYEYIVDRTANTCTIKIDDSDVTSSSTIEGGFTDGKTFYIGRDSASYELNMWGRVDAFLIMGEGGPVNPTVTISATDDTATEASETTGTYRVSRGAETSGNLTVNFSVSGTATLNTDYTLSSSSSVTISDGNTYADVTLTPDDDSDVEGSETAILTVTSGTGYSVGSPSSATVTIIDDDFSEITVTATDDTATEAGETTGTFRVSRGTDTAGDLSVNFSMSGTATLNTDYSLSSSSSVTIGNGNTYADITLTAEDDAVNDDDEIAILTISSGTGYTIGTPSSDTITIVDNDETVESDTIAYWRFENNADDETGVHDATLYGSPTYYSPAAEGSYALNLDGYGRYADCDTITLGDTFTISGHVLIWGYTGIRTIFGTTDPADPDGLIGRVDLSTGVYSLVTGNGSSSATATTTTGNHSSGNWVQFEYIVDRSANTCNIKIDDSDESSTTTIVGDFTDGKTFYIGQDSTASNGTRLWGRVDALLIEGENGSGGGEPTIDTIGKINFTYTGYAETGWTNIYGTAFDESLGGGVSISTDYGFSMGNSGEPSTVFPSNVGSTYNFMYNTNNSPAYITVSGLDTASAVTYRFSFFESRDDGSASGDRTTTYTIGSESVGTNPVGNTSTVLTIDSVAADASGEVEITVTKITDQYGYINAMIIEEVTESGESRAVLDPGQNLENILSEIEYYPVPVSDRLNLKNVPSRSLISVYDMIGHKVMEQRTGLGTDLQLNVSHLKSGIYLFRILDETSSAVKNFKVVKK